MASNAPSPSLSRAQREAKAAALKLGYPVILKGIAPNVAHRSEAGLVSRKIVNDGELDREFAALAGKANGQSVEKFLEHDLEMILGVKYDPTFGPVVLCGLGGIFTEVLQDFALRLAPLSETDVADMLSSLRALPILKRAPANIDLLTEALLRLSDLAVELNGKIQAVDINPIALGAELPGAIVLDAKVHI